MQSPRASQTSLSKGPPVAVAATGFRARLGQEYARLLPRIRWHLTAAGLGQAADLEDRTKEVLQEVVVEALESEQRYDPQRDLRAWLHGIMMNVLRRHVERLGKARRRLPSKAPADEEPVDVLHEQLVRAGRESTGPDEALARRQEVDAVLAPLPPQHREVLRLYYLEHHQDNDAVAAALGIKPGAARVRLCRAHDAARKGGSR